MSSDPNLRMRIASKVQEKGVLRADSLRELKANLDMDEVSTTQFGKALRSLHYKYRQVRVNRPHSHPHYGSRVYEVSYLPKETRTASLAAAVV